MCAHVSVADFGRRHTAVVLVEPVYPLEDIAYIHRVALLVQGPVATLPAMCPVVEYGVNSILEHSAPFGLCRMTSAELLSVVANMFTMIP
jgi:hypothetical protein